MLLSGQLLLYMKLRSYFFVKLLITQRSSLVRYVRQEHIREVGVLQ